MFFRSQILMDLTLSEVEKSGEEGVSTPHLNKAIIEGFLRVSGVGADISVFERRPTHDHLHKMRCRLAKDGKISFDKRTKRWKCNAVKARNLTEKEGRFLKAKGLGPGWVNIADKLEAIKWLHREFSDSEFEEFCCALLRHSNVENPVVTEKRESGADGGIDGTGTYRISDMLVPIVFQAKRNAINTQIGTDICQKLAGAMLERHIHHGFLITTGTFSVRAHEAIKKIEEHSPYQIELIDQDRMAEIMICTKDKPHGFGLHRTEIGLIYMNQDILKQSIRGKVKKF